SGVTLRMPMMAVRGPSSSVARGRTHLYCWRIAIEKKGFRISDCARNPKSEIPFEIPLLFLLPYAGDGFSCGEMLGAGRTTPLDGAGVGFSFFGSAFDERRSSSGWPAMSILISAA